LEKTVQSRVTITLVITSSRSDLNQARRYSLKIPSAMPVATLGEWLASQPGEEAQALSNAFLTAAGFAQFGHGITTETLLKDGDRLEFLRPLLADPKLARRQRVEAGRAARARQGQFDRWTRNR
jgi:hypothetical protein